MVLECGLQQHKFKCVCDCVQSPLFSKEKDGGERDRFLREGTAVHELCVCGNSVARLNILNLTVVC